MPLDSEMSFVIGKLQLDYVIYIWCSTFEIKKKIEIIINCPALLASIWMAFIWKLKSPKKPNFMRTSIFFGVDDILFKLN